MTIYEVLQSTNLPCVFSHFKKKDSPKQPPYICYIGDGQDTFNADNTYYYSKNRYQVELYFTEKDESIEANLEGKLLENGFLYEKSEDTYIEQEGVFVIYYSV